MMKKGAYFSCLMLILSLHSCTEEPSEIGSDFFQEESIDINFFDTLTLKVSTVQIENVITSTSSRMLAGYHSDSDLGKIMASPYFQVTPGSIGSLANTSYSRATLLMRFDGYSYYDTTLATTFRVHEVVEEIEQEDGFLFNTSFFQYDPTPLGEITFQPRPNMSDSLEIPLSDALGLELYGLAENSSDVVASSENFLKYFRGIAVIPSTAGNGAILGFTWDAELRVYYNDLSQIPIEEEYFAFTTGSNLRFNHIDADRSETNLSLLTDESEVPSVVSDNKSYIQGGSGLALRVSIPYLRNILIDNPDLAILGAVLELSPQARPKSNNTPPPEYLIMWAVNGENENIGSSDEPVQVPLEDDVYLGRDTRYSARVLEFVNYQLSLQEFNDNALLFTLDDEHSQSSLHRLYAGDQRSERPMKLTLYYLRVKD